MNHSTYVSHPIYVNYEASPTGIVRHKQRKTPIGVIHNVGYYEILKYHNRHKYNDSQFNEWWNKKFKNARQIQTQANR